MVSTVQLTLQPYDVDIARLQSELATDMTQCRDLRLPDTCGRETTLGSESL